jgi:hypothetical protein
MTPALYEIETSEGDDRTTVPAEGIWTPEGEDAAGNGFVVHHGRGATGAALLCGPGRRSRRLGQPESGP